MNLTYQGLLKESTLRGSFMGKLTAVYGNKIDRIPRNQSFHLEMGNAGVHKTKRHFIILDDN